MIRVIYNQCVYYCLALIFLLPACRQDKRMFEGVIHYSHQSESCSDLFPYYYFQELIGMFSAYYYKNGNYKVETYNAKIPVELYIADENKLYFRVSGQTRIHFSDVSEQMEDIVSYSIKKNQAKILGYDCDLFSMVTKKKKSGIRVYWYIYYSPEIKIDPMAFSKFRYMNEDFIASKTRSLPLRIIMQSEEMEINREATDVDFVTLNDSIFYLPGMTEAKLFAK